MRFSEEDLDAMAAAEARERKAQDEFNQALDQQIARVNRQNKQTRYLLLVAWIVLIMLGLALLICVPIIIN